MKRRVFALALTLTLCIATLSACSDIASQEPIPSGAESSSPAPSAYKRIDFISTALNEYMKTGFSETNWYGYINEYSVYSDGESYSAYAILTEKPFDYSLSVLMWKYFTNAEAEIVTPIILDAAYGLDPDSKRVRIYQEGL